jgi:predicted metalloprotease with PDZ domain
MAAAKQHAGVHFSVQVADLHAHLFEVTLTVSEPAAQQRLSLPVWIPGSYLVREFSKNLQQMVARQGPRRVALRQLDKHTWEVDSKPGQTLVVTYRVYAFDNSVRTAWLDATRGFFNGTSLFLMVQGQEERPHTMELVASKTIAHWEVATGASAQFIDKSGFGSYHAANYSALVDCPVEMGAFWSGTFVACGVPHRFVVAGAPPAFDGAKLLADTQAICEAEIRFWHAGKKPPFSSYVFMLNAVNDSYGGLEHGNSTALICNRRDLPQQASTALVAHPHKQPEGYSRLLGLISHEYFHTWNVKRLRPAELASYDYARENYTELLWFFEGFTSYYDDILLVRARRIDHTAYLQLLAKTINLVQQTPGRRVQSVAQASFDAWVKYYRPDENTPNATISYYTKGALVALCLDLTLRKEGHTTLDAVMVALWHRCRGGPMAEQDLLEVLSELGQRPYAPELARWVHGTTELPVATLLQLHGIEVLKEPEPLAHQLGLRIKDGIGLHIQQVLRGGAAEQAGFASGDEWIGVQPLPARGSKQGSSESTWRLESLGELPLYAGSARRVSAWVARDRRLMTLTLQLPKPSHAARLSVKDTAAATRWLNGE